MECESSCRGCPHSMAEHVQIANGRILESAHHPTGVGLGPEAGLPPAELDPFFYTPLGDASRRIRLLNIVNTNVESDSIECSVTTFDMDKVPPFFAISYTWGPAYGQENRHAETSPRIVLYCSNGARKGLLGVTKNLSLALKRFHSPSESEGEDKQRPIVPPGSFLRIDAICINQADLDERTQQVQMMDQIFSLAHAVIVWLGPDPDNSVLTITDLMTKCEKMVGLVEVETRESGLLGNEVVHRNHAPLLSTVGLPEASHPS